MVPSHPNSRTSFFLDGGRISAQRAEELEVEMEVVVEGTTTKALVVPVARRTRAVESFMVGSSVALIRYFFVEGKQRRERAKSVKAKSNTQANFLAQIATWKKGEHEMAI